MNIIFVKKIEKYLINHNFTLKEVITTLNDNDIKNLFFVKKNKIIGSITDGDIRRGLIKGFGFNDNIQKFINSNPLVVYSKTNFDKIKNFMMTNFINCIPLVNKKNIPLGMYINLIDSTENILNVPLFIMAGGKGTRLQEFTKKIPKPLLKINNKSIIEHIILRAKKLGIFEFIISINYLGSFIKKTLKNGRQLDVKINYIEEKKELGTAGSLSLLKKKLVRGEEIIVTNGDILSNINYQDLIKFHRLHNSVATMVVSTYVSNIPYGVVNSKKLEIIDLQEKPSFQHYVNAGIYVINKKYLSLMKKNEQLDMTDFFNILKKHKKKIIIYPIYDRWHDIGDKAEYLNIRNNNIF